LSRFDERLHEPRHKLDQPSHHQNHKIGGHQKNEQSDPRRHETTTSFTDQEKDVAEGDVLSNSTPEIKSSLIRLRILSLRGVGFFPQLVGLPELREGHPSHIALGGRAAEGPNPL
jgi:hypothetical protein